MKLNACLTMMVEEPDFIEEHISRLYRKFLGPGTAINEQTMKNKMALLFSDRLPESMKNFLQRI